MASPLFSRRNITVNCGMSRTGKTTLGIRYLLNAPLHYRFIFDPDPGEFNPSLGEYSDRLKTPAASNEIELTEALMTGLVVFDPWKMFPGEVEKAFEWFCKWVFEIALQLPGNKVFLADEVWRYCTPQAIPFHLTRIVKEGGKRGLRTLVNTQEPQRLNGRLLAEMSELICFRLQLEKALDFAEQYGFSRAEVSDLQPLQFVARNLDTNGELRSRLKV